MINSTVKTVGRHVKMACLACVAAVAAILSCEGTGPTASDMDEIVVQAYLFTGRPVNTVRLKHMGKSIITKREALEVIDKETGEVDTIDTVINEVTERYIDDAVVTISSLGISYALTSRGTGWYHDINGNLLISMGQTYRIDVTAGGKHVWAETTVPTLIGGITVSRDTIYLADNPEDTCGKYGCKDDPKEKTGKLIDDVTAKVESSEGLPDSLKHLTVKWNSPGDGYLFYRYVYENGSGGSYTEADSFLFSCRKDEDNGWSIYSDSTGLITSGPGKYKLFCYMTAPEFRFMVKDMFNDTTHQDLWIRSSTNINGGLGYFSSFCIDSVSVNVIQWSGGNF